MACALTFALATAFPVLPAGAATLKGGVPLKLPFPRVAMWWPDNDSQPAADRARYDWIELQNRDADHIAELRRLNPDIIVLGSADSRELNFDERDYASFMNEDIRKASNKWILTQAGSTLTRGVDASATVLPVESTSRFREGDLLVIDEELALVTSVGGRSLTVQRGIAKPALAHRSGTRVAAAVSPWKRMVVFDVSRHCATADVGHGPETWTTFYARLMRETLDAADWDGVCVDSYTANASYFVTSGLSRSLDPDRTNRPVADLDAFDKEWNEGMVSVGDALRAAVGPDKVVVVNCGVRNYKLNGKNFEIFPRSDTQLDIWKIVVLGPWGYTLNESYLDWLKYGAQPNLSTIQTYEYDGALPDGWRDGFVPDYQKMRFGLATALMGDGFYIYEVSMYGHGTLGLYWFDEFDNAGKERGYLGQPTGPAAQVPGMNVWRRDYQRGVVLVNPDAVPNTVSLGGTFRRIKGKQAPSVNDGTLTDSATLQPRDGIILLRDEPEKPASRTPARAVARPPAAVPPGRRWYVAEFGALAAVAAAIGLAVAIRRRAARRPRT